MTAKETAIREEMGVLQESALAVDTSGPRPIVKQAKLVGLTSRNGRIYRPAGLKAAIPLYEGARINDDHPKGPAVTARGYGERMGHVIAGSVNFREGFGLFGDLSMNPKHALTEQFLNDAQYAPHNVALSHNVLGKVVREGMTAVVEAISRVISVDVVGDPGSTNSLFESFEDSEAMKTTKKTLRVLLAESLTALAPSFVTVCEANAIGLDAEFEVAEGATPDAQLTSVVESMILQTIRESSNDKFDKLRRFDLFRADIVAKKSPVLESYKSAGSGAGAGGASSLPNNGGASAGSTAFETKVLESLAQLGGRLNAIDDEIAKGKQASLSESLCLKHGVKPTPTLLAVLEKLATPAEKELEIVMNHTGPQRGPRTAPVRENNGGGNYTPPADHKALAARIMSN